MATSILIAKLIGPVVLVAAAGRIVVFTEFPDGETERYTLDTPKQGLYLPPSGYEVCFLNAAHTDDELTDAAEVLANMIQQEAHQWA